MTITTQGYQYDPAAWAQASHQSGLAAALKVVLNDLNAEALRQGRQGPARGRITRLVAKGQLAEGFVQEAERSQTLGRERPGRFFARLRGW